jgi:hypothetical protein
VLARFPTNRTGAELERGIGFLFGHDETFASIRRNSVFSTLP